MKRVIALFLSAILLVSLSVPAFAAEPQQSNRIHAALDTPEFKSAYKDLQVVNEIIEEVPNSNICYIVSVKPRHVKRPPSQGELLLTKMAVSLRIYVLRLQSNLIAHRHT